MEPPTFEDPHIEEPLDILFLQTEEEIQKMIMDLDKCLSNLLHMKSRFEENNTMMEIIKEVDETHNDGLTFGKQLLSIFRGRLQNQLQPVT